jgi:hypothetical protein
MTVDSDFLFSQWRRTTRARQAAAGTPTRKSEASPAKGTPKSAAPAVMSARQPTSAEESESDDQPLKPTPAPKVRKAADPAAEGPKAKKHKAKKQGK